MVRCFLCLSPLASDKYPKRSKTISETQHHYFDEYDSVEPEGVPIMFGSVPSLNEAPSLASLSPNWWNFLGIDTELLCECPMAAYGGSTVWGGYLMPDIHELFTWTDDAWVMTEAALQQTHPQLMALYSKIVDICITTGLMYNLVGRLR